MRSLGTILIIVGVIWGLVAFNMKTTVNTEGRSIAGFSLPSMEVNNIGLMEERRNHLMGSGLTLLIGVILFAAAGKTSQNVSDNNSRKCPFCAELVKQEAIICKYCGKDLPPFVAPASASELDGIKQKIVCWNCSKFNSSILDGTVGKCKHHNRKVKASESCENHSPNSNFA